MVDNFMGNSKILYDYDKFKYKENNDDFINNMQTLFLKYNYDQEQKYNDIS